MERKKNKNTTLSELIIESIENQMIEGINNKKFEKILHKIVTDKIQEWMK